MAELIGGTLVLATIQALYDQAIYIVDVLLAWAWIAIVFGIRK